MSVQRFILVQVVDPRLDEGEAEASLKELHHLVDTYGAVVVDEVTQKRVHPHPSTFIGPGKLDGLKDLVKEHEIDVVVLNAIAKSSQLFRLEKTLWDVNTQIEVWDKVDLILNIFDQHAKTTEAKLQIELARIQHGGPRIYGLGGTVLSRQGGGIGTRGLGETNIEIERRQMKKRIQTLKKELHQRAQQQAKRIARRQQQGIFTSALVGYTSAGKTTLFNALTKKDKQTHAGLFTTLDSVVGKVKFDRTPPVLVSDTIGFIEDLPPNLISAFRSTLQESLEARVLLHVIDAASPERMSKMEVVDSILQEMEVKTQPVLVFNKVDLLSPSEKQALLKQFASQTHFLVSAKTEEGVAELKAYLQQAWAQEQTPLAQPNVASPPA